MDAIADKFKVFYRVVCVSPSGFRRVVLESFVKRKCQSMMIALDPYPKGGWTYHIETVDSVFESAHFDDLIFLAKKKLRPDKNVWKYSFEELQEMYEFCKRFDCDSNCVWNMNFLKDSIIKLFFDGKINLIRKEEDACAE